MRRRPFLIGLLASPAAPLAAKGPTWSDPVLEAIVRSGGRVVSYGRAMSSKGQPDVIAWVENAVGEHIGWVTSADRLLSITVTRIPAGR